MTKETNILLIGSSGQLGTELNLYLKSIGNLKTPQNSEFIFISVSDLNNKLSKIKPNIIINTLAFTQVENAENNKEKAIFLNTTFPEMLSKWCYQNQCLLIHYSSDYVFSGKGNLPKKESSKAKPLNFYGVTKLKGDNFIKKSGASSIILRCSWIYSISHNSFLKSMLTKMKNEEEFSVVSDQIGTPTSAKWVARITFELIKKRSLLQGYNLINCTPNGYVSWYGFSTFIFNTLKQEDFKLKTKKIIPINSDALSQKVLRPKNSRLDNFKLRSILNYQISNWQNILEDELKNIIN